MKSHIFHQKYANTPLADRMKTITHESCHRYGSTIEPISLAIIYRRVKELEDKMRPDVIELEKLLSRAAEYYEK